MVEAGWVEPVGRREPGISPSVSALPTAARPARIRWERDLAVAVLLIAAVVALRMTSHVAAPTAARPGGIDIFAAAQVRDLRMALDLYRREHGVYPGGLQELVADGWLSHDRLQVAGHELRYRSQPGRQDYQIDLTAAP